MISHPPGDRLVLGFYWGFTGQIRYLKDKIVELALRRMLAHANTGVSSSLSNSLHSAARISIYSVFPPVCVCYLLSKGCFFVAEMKTQTVEWVESGRTGEFR